MDVERFVNKVRGRKLSELNRGNTSSEGTYYLDKNYEGADIECLLGIVS